MATAVEDRQSPARARLSARSPRRALAAAAVAAAVTLVAWQTGDWWDTGGASRNLTVARVLIFGTVFGLAWAIVPLVRRSGRIARVVFVAWTAYLGLWLAAIWPGLIVPDTMEVVSRARLGVVYEWFSYLHSVINVMVLDLVPHVATFGVLQALGTAALMAFASSVLLEWRRSVPAVVAMNVVAALSAPVVANSLLYSRDTIYTLVQVALALYVARAVVLRRTLPPAGLAGIALAVGFLSVYRSDGIALLACVPLVLLLLRPSRRAAGLGAAAFAGAALLFHVVLPATMTLGEEDPHAYALSLRINPLGAVLNTDFNSPDKAADLAALGRVIDVEGVRQLHTPADIPAFWQNRWNRQASEADFAAFTSTADRLILENPRIVLRNRLEVFGTASGLGGGQFTLPYGELDAGHRWVPPEGLAASPPSQELKDGAIRVAAYTSEYTGRVSLHSALHWNLLPWLLLLAGALAGFRRFPLQAVVAVVILCRVPLVFLFAPAAQYKYYYAVELGGIVVLGLLLAHVRFKRAR